MSNQRVQLFGQARGVVIEANATIGAVFGQNLVWPDGRLVQVSDFQQTASSYPTTFWRLIQEIPANVTALADTATTGIYVVTGAGTSATRSIAGAAGQITVTSADGVAGNPEIGLADVANAAGGAIQLTAFDAKGRRTSANPATTDNLAEGSTNLWFTQARVRATTLTGLSVVTGGAIAAADTVLEAFGKLQNQVSLRLTDAPSDSSTYGRRNGAWVTTIGEAPIDGATYGRKNGAWVVVTGGGGGGGTVTSVDGSGGTTGLTLTGGPITGSGTLTLGGTLAIANGGTGATTASAARTAFGAASSGAIGSSGLTMNTARLLGRGTSGVGAPEEISMGSGLSFAGNVLSVSGATILPPGGTTTVLRADNVWSDTLTGNFAAANFLTTGLVRSGSIFESSSATAILASTGAGTVLLRPNGAGSSIGQFLVDASGNAVFSGDLRISRASGTDRSLYFQTAGSNRWGIICGAAAETGSNAGSNLNLNRYDDTGTLIGTVVQANRQTGVINFVAAPTIGGSTLSSLYVSKSGDTMTGPLTATQLTASGGFVVGATNLVLATSGAAGNLLFRPNGGGSTSGQAQLDSNGLLSVAATTLYAAGQEFYRANANSTTTVRQPRIFVGGSDPGAAAADGDIWIP